MKTWFSSEYLKTYLSVFVKCLKIDFMKHIYVTRHSELGYKYVES